MNDFLKSKVVERFLKDGKLPEVEISISPGTMVGLGFTAFVVAACLYMFTKFVSK